MACRSPRCRCSSAAFPKSLRGRPYEISGFVPTSRPTWSATYAPLSRSRILPPSGVSSHCSQHAWARFSTRPHSRGRSAFPCRQFPNGSVCWRLLPRSFSFRLSTRISANGSRSPRRHAEVEDRRPDDRSSRIASPALVVPTAEEHPRRLSFLLLNPRIDHEADAIEVPNVARRHHRLPRTGNAGDLHVSDLDAPARLF